MHLRWEIEDSSVLVYSFLEANAGKAWLGTNRVKRALEWLTRVCSKPYARSSLQCPRQALLCVYEPSCREQRSIMVMLVLPEA
ncbi:hypothetical protein SETIT_2G260200v2 [Setaria italica]|uniref:Uncharacterized protein n=1 Tax=Setaria italica TaxID=4555 RepID=K3ZYL8_SETIT|nr:hypothetical protein SETIT_2G260200v2 [Setaria italica]